MMLKTCKKRMETVLFFNYYRYLPPQLLLLDYNQLITFFYSHTDINECIENKTLCSNEVENCANTLGSYMCICVTGYSMSSNGTCEGNTHTHICISCNSFVKEVG